MNIIKRHFSHAPYEEIIVDVKFRNTKCTSKFKVRRYSYTFLSYGYELLQWHITLIFSLPKNYFLQTVCLLVNDFHSVLAQIDIIQTIGQHKISVAPHSHSRSLYPYACRVINYIEWNMWSKRVVILLITSHTRLIIWHVFRLLAFEILAFRQQLAARQIPSMLCLSVTSIQTVSVHRRHWGVIASQITGNLNVCLTDFTY